MRRLEPFVRAQAPPEQKIPLEWECPWPQPDTCSIVHIFLFRTLWCPVQLDALTWMLRHGASANLSLLRRLVDKYEPRIDQTQYEQTQNASLMIFIAREVRRT